VFAAVLAVLLAAEADAAAAAAASVPGQLECIARTYNVKPANIGGRWFALLPNGKRIPFDDGKAKSFDEKLASPDVEDLFSIPYWRGAIHEVREENNDPGRIRIEPILAATYGGDYVVAAQQIRMRFLGLPVRVHALIASALGRVAARLEEARKRDPSLDPFLRRLSGGFARRKIAGTERTSAHAFGIAIDLDKSTSDYWRWQKTKPIRWRNRIPQAIVDAFEAEGFIWGGRWYHYDTMHFEYRPELLDERCRFSADSDSRKR
jgi:hypothetical protein